MPAPHLTFFCELDPAPLKQLVDDQLIKDLKSLGAKISLGLRDLSSERAEVVSRLNQAGIPVDAWLLLPEEEGYWFNLRNYPQAFSRYFEFKKWTAENRLQWAAVGLDIEPDIHDLTDFTRRNWRSLPQYILRLFARMEWRRGMAAYRNLVSQIHEDGYRVETYQMPLIEDERKAHSSVLQRVMGLVNLPADREVWMLYTSFVRPHGAGMLASYAREAQAVAVGSTGGGVGVDLGSYEPLGWDEFGRDLRLAWYWCDDLYIFSLEGCAAQGFLEPLKSFSWDYPVILPETGVVRIDGWRRSLQSMLWIISNLAFVLGTAIGGLLLWKIIQRMLAKQKERKSNQM